MGLRDQVPPPRCSRAPFPRGLSAPLQRSATRGAARVPRASSARRPSACALRRWLASNGGRLQFVTLGPDAFAISHFAAADGAEPTASTWIAFRDGASIAAGPAEGAKKKSLLHRYWMHLVFAIGLAGWRHSKAKAKKS